MSTLEPERIIIQWGGARRRVRVVKRFKNGKIRVELLRGMWVGGKPGSLSNPVRVTIEPWQVVPDPTNPPTTHTEGATP